MATSTPVKPIVVPQFGIIRGGQLDGWRFHFLRFKIAPRDLFVVARCTPPNWPFPCDIEMVGGKHFSQLRAVPGSRAKRLDAASLIASAYTLEGQPAPAWLFDAPAVKTIRSATRAAQRSP